MAPNLTSTPHSNMFQGSVGISGIYMGVVEFWSTQTLPIVLAPVLFNSHPIIPLLGTCVGSLNSVQSHGCYAFPFMTNPRYVLRALCPGFTFH